MSSELVNQGTDSEHQKVTELFVHGFKQAGREYVLKIPVQIPLDMTIREFGFRIINCHSVACYNEEGNFP